jgi:hypothetical protein
VIEVCTATEVQMPKNRQQPDSDSKDNAAAETAILELMRDLLQEWDASMVVERRYRILRAA